MGRSSFKCRKRRLHYKLRERKPSLFQPGCLVASPVNVPSKANGPTLRSSSSNIPSVNDEKVPTSVEVESSRPLTRGHSRSLRGRGKRYVLDKNMGSAAAGLIISKAIGHHISKV